MVTRRQFSQVAAAGLVLPALTGKWPAAAPVGGVRLSVQTYSFRALPRPAGGDAVDVVIDAMKACGLDECELWSPQLEPAQSGGREELRRWCVSTPMTHFATIRALTA